MATNLRQLMKTKEAERAARINHALARYNNLDQLVCKLCNQVIKSDALWQPHLLSKRHKELMEDLKSGKLKPSAKPTVAAAAATAVVVQTPQAPPTSEKKRKEPEPAAVNAAANNLGGDDDGGDGGDKFNDSNQTTKQPSRLPEGFFDDPKAQQAVEDELTKAAFARLADARAPPTVASQRSTSVASTTVDDLVAEFEKDLPKQPADPAVGLTQQGTTDQTAEPDDDQDVDEEAQRLLEEQQQQLKRLEQLKRKALENAKKPVATAKKVEKVAEDEDFDEENVDELLLDWRSKNV